MHVLDLVARPRHGTLMRCAHDSAERVHVTFGLPAPRNFDDARPLAIGAEQLGVELRPATIYKLLILDALGKQGHDAIFLLEDRDVVSKDKRLRGWSIPAPGAPEPRRISPVERSVTKAVAEMPLVHVPVVPDYARAAEQLVTHYVPLVAPAETRALKNTVYDLMGWLAAAAGRATTLAELGQRQLVHFAQALGIRHVTFVSTGAIEDHVLANDRLRELVPLDDIAAAGLVPAGCATHWGIHDEPCHGRVRVPTAGRATCLRCGATLDACRPHALRAAVRMFLMQALGAAVFVVGGTSAYNDELRAFRHARGEDYLPLVWQSCMPYVGPAQRGDRRVRVETTAGGASIVDALVAHGLEAGLDQAFVQLGENMRAWLASEGTHHVAGHFSLEVAA